MNIQKIVLAVLIAFTLAAVPASAVSIFADGFNDGTTCAWGPMGCVTVTLIDDSAEAPVDGHEEWADYTVQFTVHAAGRDLWFEKEAARSPNPNLTKGFWFSIESDSGTYSGGITPFSMSATCPAPCQDTPTHFKVSANTVRTFWMNVRLDNAGGVIGFYQMQITGLVYKFDGANGDGTVLITSGLSNLDTVYIFVDDENVDPIVGGPNSYEDFHNNNL